MRAPFAVGIAFACLAGRPLAPCAHGGTQSPDFRPARAVSIADVTIPIRSVAIGTVVLDVTITEEGGVGEVQVRRDIPSETEQAVRSVRAWKFDPARLNGRAVASKTTVAVTFEPQLPLAKDRSSLPPLIHHDEESRPGPSFTPPGVIHAVYPMCPPNALLPGTVVLEISIDVAGAVRRIDVLRDFAPFTAVSIQAVDEWKFTPATMHGNPVGSNVVLVFCFRQPLTSWR